MTQIFLSQTLLFATTDSKGPLEQEYHQNEVAGSFKVGGAWWPYPAYSDRTSWNQLMSEQLRANLVADAEKQLDYKWQHIPASTFIALHTTGDKQQMRRIDRQNRQAIIDLMLGELAEGKGRFLPQIADGMWFFATSHHWSHSNQTHGVLPRYASERIALGNIRHAATLPVVYHFFKEELDKIEPMICEAFRETIKRIILDPFLDDSQDKRNWWLGFDGGLINNWNPWCNHGVILSFMLVEHDQERLNKALAKSVRSVDNYLRAYSADGACEEGATYWTQSVSRFCEYLQLLKDASYGKFDILPDTFIKSMGEYKSRVTIGKNINSGKTVSVNYGDGAMIGSVNPFMIWKVGSLLESRELEELALYECGDYLSERFVVPSVSEDEGYRSIENIRWHKSLSGSIKVLNNRLATRSSFHSSMKDLRDVVPSYTWYPELQQMFVHTSGGCFVSAKAGNNGEPHGHNDVGNFIICIDGVPMIVDPGVGTYVKDTFGDRRYTIWTMQSLWHNCPVVNGLVQKNGKNYSEGKRYAASDVKFIQKRDEYSLIQQMAEAYGEKKDSTSWVRTITVKDKQGPLVVLSDEFKYSARNGADVEHFMTPGKIQLNGRTAEITNQGKVIKLMWSKNLTGYVEEKIMDDQTSRSVWGDRLYRLVLKSADVAPLSGRYEIIFNVIN